MIKKEFFISLPGDMSDVIDDFYNQAITEAREDAEDYVMPATWEVEKVSGEIGDNEIVFKVIRLSNGEEPLYQPLTPENILDALEKQSFYDWYNGAFEAYITCDDECPTKTEILENIVKIFGMKQV